MVQPFSLWLLNRDSAVSLLSVLGFILFNLHNIALVYIIGIKKEERELLNSRIKHALKNYH